MNFSDLSYWQIIAAIGIAAFLVLAISSAILSIFKAYLAAYRKCKGGCKWRPIMDGIIYSHGDSTIAVRQLMVCRKCGETKDALYLTPPPKSEDFK